MKENEQPITGNKILWSLKQAVPGTWKSASWLLKLMIPISLAVVLLQYTGILEWLAGYLNPVFNFMGLPGEAAIVFVSGAMAGTYSGVVAMMAIPMTLRQATIMGIMVLICHALPMECSINRKTGSSFWKMALIRIVMAFVSAVYLNLVLPEMNEAYVYLGADTDSTFAEVMIHWGLSQLKTIVMVFGIVYSLMFMQMLIEAYGWLKPMSRFFAPLMTVMGLPRESSYMWLVGNVLGISYGSAVMVDLESKGLITRKDANDVNYHLIMNHSMLEDTIVMAVTGISVLWIISTRVLFAFVLVWGRRGWKAIVGNK